LLESLPQSDLEWIVFTNLLTTNKTDFFREPAHFDFLKKEVVPNWLKKKRSVLKVWSAASSTGEEPYTISMVLNELLSDPVTYQILATDIDTEVLRKAEKAVYAKSKLGEIPEKFRRSSIDVGSGEISSWMRIKSHLKNKVTYEPFNLIESELPAENEFDVVFCRNVLIYFTPDTTSRVLNRLYAATRPGGYLFIGHSESMQNMKTKWVSVAPSIYLKPHPVK
jgi:chemotaxis methyl-accepting protein methylase